MSYDLIVIGAGPGGYVAAIRAAQIGMKTAIVERDRLGGVCLNWGCIPTKALLRAADVFRSMNEAEAFGLKAERISFDPTALISRSRKVAERLSNGVQFLMKKHKIDVVMGEARLERGAPAPAPRVRVGERVLEAKRVILATGARARLFPESGLAPDGKRIWTSREAMTPPEWPESLLVFGAGAIGVEFASFYAAFGVKVTLVEMQPRILPNEDEEIAAFAAKRFQRAGIIVRAGARALHLASDGQGVRAEIAVGEARETLNASHAIIALGIVGNVDGFGLEELGVKVERHHVEIDEAGRTNVPGLFAIGDVTGAPWLAHKAMHEGVACVEAMAGAPAHAPRIDHVPSCTYSHPQVASIGLTEAAAKAAGRSIRVGRFPLTANGKAIALGEDQGLVKTIFDGATGELLGAHMVGAEVTELVQGFAIAMTGELTEAELMATIFPHPTISEAMHESVLDAYGRALHI